MRTFYAIQHDIEIHRFTAELARDLWVRDRSQARQADRNDPTIRRLYDWARRNNVPAAWALQGDHTQTTS